MEEDRKKTGWEEDGRRREEDRKRDRDGDDWGGGGGWGVCVWMGVFFPRRRRVYGDEMATERGG